MIGLLKVRVGRNRGCIGPLTGSIRLGANTCLRVHWVYPAFIQTWTWWLHTLTYWGRNNRSLEHREILPRKHFV